MKFALNGALTIGTLDGANIEIREAVGEENFFLFGLTADQVTRYRPQHDPRQVYNSNDDVRRALDAIGGGEFNAKSPELFRPIVDWLTEERDYYMLLADIESYLSAQQQVDLLWGEPRAWARAAILNIARIGHFSSDRAVREYAEQIWRVAPTPIKTPSEAIWKRPGAALPGKTPAKTVEKSARTGPRVKTPGKTAKTGR
jgi:starch phosphorylase